eukprot:TRINITY_DN7723_c0_g1_i8.p1 TRINITY_DN7723_c0_g1~~TRINITY_DN7723_c0_g1_i8.p1  ORF type:complete len:755 (+),score=99.88 TRINITY_DN7723_c0_g1_i8:215-2479(+)
MEQQPSSLLSKQRQNEEQNLLESMKKKNLKFDQMMQRLNAKNKQQEQSQNVKDHSDSTGVGLLIAQNSPKSSNLRRDGSYSSLSLGSKKTVQFRDEGKQVVESGSEKEKGWGAHASVKGDAIPQVSVHEEQLQGRSTEEYLGELQQSQKRQELLNTGHESNTETYKFLNDHDDDDSDSDSGWPQPGEGDNDEPIPVPSLTAIQGQKEEEVKNSFVSNVPQHEMYAVNNGNNTDYVNPNDLFRYVQEGRMTLEAMQVLMALVDNQQQVQHESSGVNSQSQQQQQQQQLQDEDNTPRRRYQNIPKGQQSTREAFSTANGQYQYREQQQKYQYPEQQQKLQEGFQQEQSLPQFQGRVQQQYHPGQGYEYRDGDEESKLLQESMQEMQLNTGQEDIESFDQNSAQIEDSNYNNQDQDEGLDGWQIQQQEAIWRALDNQFQRKLFEIKPTLEEIECMRTSIRIVTDILTLNFPDRTCHLYGSAGNNLWVHKHNDLDICIKTYEDYTDKDFQQEIVHEIADVMEQCYMKDIERVCRTRIPICKFTIPQTGTEVDISVNNLLPVHNTNLINAYCEMDPQIRDLIYIVKQWAKSRKLNSTRDNTLSSYAYAVLVIHFMQKTRGVPNLQERADENLELYQDWNVYYRKDVGRINRRDEDNVLLGKLVEYFFKYYSHFLRFQARSWIISVRCGGWIHRQEKLWGGDKRHLFSIEDPFEEDHDLGDVITDTTFQVVKREFERATDILRTNYQDVNVLFSPRSFRR